MRLGLLFLAVLPLLADTLDDRVAAAIAASPTLARAHWGVHAVRLDTGQTVYARNQASYFTPASTAKLFSTALALSRLGPNHRFLTRLVESGGNLYFIGGGDPTLSGRPIPYDRDAPFSSPLGALQALVDQAWTNGLREIPGDIVGDDSRYLFEPFPDGWAVDDTFEEYGAPVSALILHDNAVTVRVRAAAAPGDPPALSVLPDIGYFQLSSHVNTQARPVARLRITRPLGSRTFSLWGSLPPKGATAFPAAVDDPALYAAAALRHLLIRRGVTVRGNIAARHYLPSATSPPAPIEGAEWARRLSPPLHEVLRVVNKVSHNLHAEIALREAAREHAPEPSRRAALDLLRSFLTGLGIDPADFRIDDGSGLSRLNATTPRALTRLLAAMHASPLSATWVSLLPISATDGSLAHRFRDWAPGRVTAKTGGMTHVTSLAGYGQSATGQTLAFAILVNNSNAPGAETRAAIDRIVKAILE